MKKAKLLMLPLLMFTLASCGSTSGGGGQQQSTSQAKQEKGTTEEDAYTSISEMLKDKEAGDYHVKYLKFTVTHSWDENDTLFFSDGTNSIGATRIDYVDAVKTKMEAANVSIMPDALLGYEVTIKGQVADAGNTNIGRYTNFVLKDPSVVAFNETRKVQPTLVQEQCTYTVLPGEYGKERPFDEYTEEHWSALGDTFQCIESRGYIVLSFGTSGYNYSLKKVVITAAKPLMELEPIEFSRMNRQSRSTDDYDKGKPIKVNFNENRQIVLDSDFFEGKHVNSLTMNADTWTIFSVSFDLN